MTADRVVGDLELNGELIDGARTAPQQGEQSTARRGEESVIPGNAPHGDLRAPGPMIGLWPGEVNKTTEHLDFWPNRRIVVRTGTLCHRRA
jgi:hypothetical protein